MFSPYLHCTVPSYTGSPGIIPGLPCPPAPLWQSIPVCQSNTGSPSIILGLPSPPAPLWQSIPECRSNTGTPGIIPGLPSPPQHPCGRVSWYAGVTPAVPGLSRDYLPPQHPCGRVSQYVGVTPAVPGLSRDYLPPPPPAPLWQSIPECRSNTGTPGIIPGLPSPPQHPCGRVSWYAGVTPAVPGLSRDYLPPQHPCGRVSQYVGVTPAVPGLSRDYLPPPPPQHPCGRVSRYAGVTPAVPGLSRDYLPPPPAPLWQSIPVRRSNTGSPSIIPGLPSPQHPCGRVSRYAGVTPAVPALSRDYLPPSTPVAEYPGTPE